MEQAAGVRIQKALAQAGLGSRRTCDALVSEGRVSVNGRVADPGTRVDIAVDRIEVDGRPVTTGARTVVLMLHKPAGMVTTMSDERGRPCVGDLVRDHPERLFHVGRLDEDTEGLLLLTNDGDLAHRLMHPSLGVRKRYVATVRGEFSESTAARLRSGITLEDGPVRADALTIRHAGRDRSVVELDIHEGRKRIVRRMLREVGHPVLRLVRTHLGPLALGPLPVGAIRPLNERELQALRELH